MSRYQFTDSNGFTVCGAVTARTASEAAVKARSLTGRSDLLCTHLSDDHSVTGTDAIFHYGPDAV
jgi:hypothetical protein